MKAVQEKKSTHTYTHTNKQTLTEKCRK